MSECVFGLAEERPGVVALAVAESPDVPYRPAEEGEAVIPVTFEDAWCVEHDDGPGCFAYDLSWSRA